MNTKQMQAALAKINPKTRATKAVTHQASEPLLVRTAATIGAAVPVVRKNADTFFGAMKTSYQYHEAVRRGDIKAD